MSQNLSPKRYHVGMHIPNAEAHYLDLCWYWSDSIPDICAMAAAVPGIEDIMAFDLSTHTYAMMGAEVAREEMT